MIKNTLLVLALSMLASGSFAADTYTQTPGSGSSNKTGTPNTTGSQSTNPSDTSMDAHSDRTDRSVDVQRRPSTTTTDKSTMPDEKTAMEQGSSAKDMALTRSIRERITADNSLSTRAKNITVISENGKITLKGAVANSAEKSKVEELAKKASGAKTVDNLTEVETY